MTMSRAHSSPSTCLAVGRAPHPLTGSSWPHRSKRQPIGPSCRSCDDGPRTQRAASGRWLSAIVSGKKRRTYVGDEALARSSRARLSAIMDNASVLADRWPIASGKPPESRHFLSATVHEAVHDGVHDAAPRPAPIGPGAAADPAFIPQASPQVLSVLRAAPTRFGHQPVPSRNPRESIRPHGNEWPNRGRISVRITRLPPARGTA